VLINSGVDGLLTEMAQIKTQITANSKTIGKIRNADMGHFRRKVARHELGPVHIKSKRSAAVRNEARQGARREVW